MLDEGSQTTIIRSDLAESLNLPGEHKVINLGGLKDEGEMVQGRSVSFTLTSRDGSFKYDVNEAFAIGKEQFNMPSQHLPKNFQTSEKWKYLQGLEISDIEAEDIKLLVGADIPSALLATEVKVGKKNMPYATKTPFGWSLFGMFKQNDNSWSEIEHSYHVSVQNDLQNQVERFWSTEAFGTQFNMENSLSVEDNRALKELEDSTKFNNGHYEVSMLLADKSFVMINNYHIASRRLEHLVKKFKTDENFFNMYRTEIEDYLIKGYARKLTEDEASIRTNKTWYLPHHGVAHPNKPGKIRAVFDAAAKHNGKSLNDRLITGPDLLNNLVGVLLRFRRFKIAIVADIEAMYFQVKLKPDDRDAFRFLWKEDFQDESQPITLQMMGHILGAKDSPCCACFALRKTAIDNAESFKSSTIQSVKRDFYMDDLMSSVSNEADGVLLVKEMISLLKLGGFRIAKFITNSDVVLQEIPDSDRAKNV